jgi:hypothetical protein
MASATILSIAYGIQTQEENNPDIEISEEGARSVIIAAVPGAFLVDSIPLLKYVQRGFQVHLSDVEHGDGTTSPEGCSRRRIRRQSGCVRLRTDTLIIHPFSDTAGQRGCRPASSFFPFHRMVLNGCSEGYLPSSETRSIKPHVLTYIPQFVPPPELTPSFRFPQCHCLIELRTPHP